ncbi:MAG: preprotein translocase subunit SecY [Parcubacteria group bacterium Gr01-1014_20]|nr:MAG: preprotein translocase subunit SecY [Parcubacteria group bacterium Gr01-1014_20]
MNRFLQIFQIKDIRNKILIVSGLLVVFRILAAIPIPGIDVLKLREYFGNNQLLGFLNIFSGGGLDNLSVVMLGVGPYITATIIMQLLTMIFPKMKQMYHEEGAQGKAKFNRYSRMLTVPLAAIQSYAFLNILANQGIVSHSGAIGLITNVLTITAGSVIALWLGELITEQKIGNGVSLIILAGIVTGVPTFLRQASATFTPSQLPTYLGFVVIAVLLVAGIVFLNEGERKVPIAYARRVRGTKLYGGSSSYLPLKVNQAGMIPLIFAISVLLFPQFLGQILSVFSVDLSIKVTNLVNAFLNNQLIYGTFYFFLVFIFTYFYTKITFDPNEISKNLQRSGGFIPGIRPGENTSSYFSKTINRTTFFGATFLGLIAILPLIIQPLTGIAILNISGTAILIVVSVALETMRQVSSQLTVREYEGIE